MLSIQRTPEGTMYLDDHGTILTNFDPKNEVIYLKLGISNLFYCVANVANYFMYVHSITSTIRLIYETLLNGIVFFCIFGRLIHKLGLYLRSSCF